MNGTTHVIMPHDRHASYRAVFGRRFRTISLARLNWLSSCNAQTGARAVLGTVLASLLSAIPGSAQQPSQTAFTYQGTLTHFGAPASGVYDFQFVLRDAPSNGNAIGTTNVPQVLVSNGLFVATLDYGAGSFPGAPRFLEVGLRTNGSAGAYSILSPAQPVNPSPYAIQTISATTATTAALATNAISAASAANATTAANALKLAGNDWTPIFGANDPTLPLPGSKIQNSSITSAQIAPQAITAVQIANSTITSQQLAGAIITSNQIASGSISSGNLADGVITLPKLAPLQFGTNVGIGGLGLSDTADGFTTNSYPNFADLPGSSVTVITTSNRPVLVALTLGALTNSSSFIEVDGNGAINAQLNLRFVVNGVVMPTLSNLNNEGFRVPSSAFQIICFPSAGTNRFSVQVGCGTAGNSLTVRNTRLMVKEF